MSCPIHGDAPICGCRPPTAEHPAATLREAEALVARLASARRLQPKLTAALGLGAPRPHEVAALEASLDAALDEYEAAWKEAHVVV